MYARARAWLRSKNSARVQTLIAWSYCPAKYWSRPASSSCSILASRSAPDAVRKRVDATRYEAAQSSRSVSAREYSKATTSVTIDLANGSGVIECVPNVSEGRRPDVVARMADAIRSTPGVRLLDASSDPAHNRSVFTFVGAAADVQQAVLALFERAIADVDLRDTPRRASTARRGGRRPVRAARGCDDGRLRGDWRIGRRSRSRSALEFRSICTRKPSNNAGTDAARGHPARCVRGADGQDVAP